MYAITHILSICTGLEERYCTDLIGACQCGQAATARMPLEHGAVAGYQNRVRMIMAMPEQFIICQPLYLL